jgi:hypothetical protein
MVGEKTKDIIAEHVSELLCIACCIEIVYETSCKGNLKGWIIQRSRIGLDKVAGDRQPSSRSDWTQERSWIAATNEVWPSRPRCISKFESAPLLALKMTFGG